MNLSRGKIISILILMCGVIGILVYSFAYVTTTYTGIEVNYLTVSDIYFNLTDAVDSIDLGDQIPTLDKFGVSNESFGFSISNTGDVQQNYTVRLVDQATSTISNVNIRYQLTKNGVVQDIKTMPESGIIDSGRLGAGASNNYSIVVWLDFESNAQDGTWNKVVKVEAGVINVDTSGANEPVLLDNMIPVYYDEEGKIWKKADRTNSNIDYYWYDYDSKMWANAVVVDETYRDLYLSDSETPIGSQIYMEDILAFYVWIPRFKYDLFESGSPKMINVTFEKGVSSTGTMKCNFTNGVQSCSGSGSYTHPAFNFDGEELPGFWVSKFKLSPLSSDACYNNATSTNCNKNNLSLTSIANKNILHYISLSNLFYSIRNMELSGNIYGFTNSGSTLNNNGTIAGDSNDFDIHLWKSFESGALSYLTYSKYGKYGNDSFDENDKEIFENGNFFTTGKSFIDNKLYDYNVDYYGTGASTTGTVYGVYDLDGMVNEFVMMNVLNKNNTYQTSFSGFTTIPANKYYDAYAYSSNGESFNNFYGDATREFIGFNSKTSVYPSGSYPYFTRDSVTSVTNSTGNIGLYISGRAVITVSQDVYITEW